MSAKANLAAFAGGVMFAAGLIVSGMTKPSKVVGFLDVFGRWDPSLGLVMVGAIGVHFVAYRLVRRRSAPIFGKTFHIPSRTDIDTRLWTGAAIFGVGWGLAGYCPGPALVASGAGISSALIFVAAMTTGMMIERHVIGANVSGIARRSIADRGRRNS